MATGWYIAAVSGSAAFARLPAVAIAQAFSGSAYL
jgi:hypothetical protein